MLRTRDQIWFSIKEDKEWKQRERRGVTKIITIIVLGEKGENEAVGGGEDKKART